MKIFIIDASLGKKVPVKFESYSYPDPDPYWLKCSESYLICFSFYHLDFYFWSRVLDSADFGQRIVSYNNYGYRRTCTAHQAGALFI